MTTIYFDTEFTGLTPDAKLISIGMAESPSQREFYAELTDTYAVDDCGAFCREVVLPLLDGGDTEMTLAQLRGRLWAWLAAAGPDTVLVCDCARDVVQLDQMFPDGLPSNCRLQVLGTWGNWKRRICNINRRLHRKHGWRVHHALDDARVNRLVLAN